MTATGDYSGGGAGCSPTPPIPATRPVPFVAPDERLGDPQTPAAVSEHEVFRRFLRGLLEEQVPRGRVRLEGSAVVAH